MKTIGKIQIKPEKIMKNEELGSLKGGHLEVLYHCYCSEYGGDPYWMPYWTETPYELVVNEVNFWLQTPASGSWGGPGKTCEFCNNYNNS